jgi:hypothetical protein
VLRVSKKPVVMSFRPRKVVRRLKEGVSSRGGVLCRDA